MKLNIVSLLPCNGDLTKFFGINVNVVELNPRTHPRTILLLREWSVSLHRTRSHYSSSEVQSSGLTIKTDTDRWRDWNLFT